MPAPRRPRRAAPAPIRRRTRRYGSPPGAARRSGVTPAASCCGRSPAARARSMPHPGTSRRVDGPRPYRRARPVRLTADGWASWDYAACRGYVVERSYNSSNRSRNIRRLLPHPQRCPPGRRSRFGFGVSGLMDIARLIQSAVAPVFLLTGVAATLGVLTNRLARIVDRARTLEQRLAGHPGSAQHLHADLAVLARRARYTNVAISL